MTPNCAYQLEPGTDNYITASGLTQKGLLCELDGLRPVAHGSPEWIAAAVLDKAPMRYRTPKADAPETPATRAAALQAQKEAERVAFVESIAALPEAIARPHAASQIMLAYDATTMPVEKAARFLAALPVEDGKNYVTEKGNLNMELHNMQNNPNSLKRKIELTASIQSMNTSDLARSKAKKLNYDVQLMIASNMSPHAAMNAAGVLPEWLV